MVGGGLASLRAIEKLRLDGFDGSIALVTDEPRLPYDRPPLSKEVLTGNRTIASTEYRAAAFYAEHRVDVLHEAATELDPDAHRLITRERVLEYGDVVVCTGARARRLPPTVMSADLDGVFTLRDADDAARIRRALPSAGRVVVIGAGFIGAEIASSAHALGIPVTLVEALERPLERALGPAMAEACAALHADHGSELLCGARVTAIAGSERVERVILDDGRTIDCDLVVVGIGAVPNVEWLASSGLDISDGVRCDATLKAAPGVWAAGDVARWPNPLFDRLMRCEQWTNAAEQGRHVARNILAGPTAAPFAGSNYFWSEQYGVRIQFAGITQVDEVVVVSGSASERRFLALYRLGDTVVGAFAMSAAKHLMQAKLLIERRTDWATALARCGDASSLVAARTA